MSILDRLPFGLLILLLAGVVTEVKASTEADRPWLGCEADLADCIAVPAPDVVHEFVDPALSLSPLALTMRQRGRLREDIERRIAAGEDDGHGQFDLVELDVRSGRLGSARTRLEQATPKAEGDIIWQRRRELLFGQVCAQDGDFACALAHWHAAAGSAPAPPTWQPKLYAYALWGLGREDQALAWYTAAVRADVRLGRAKDGVISGGGPKLDAIARAVVEAWVQVHAPFMITLVAKIDLDSEGRVERVVLLDESLDARLRVRVQSAIAAWTFTQIDPSTVGKALSTHVWVDVRGRSLPEGGHAFDIQYVTTGMRARDRVPPRYPGTALKRRLQGSVDLAVLVNADGQAAEVNVIRSSDHPVLDRAAVVAVSQWTFEVDRIDGQPVPGWAQVPISFRIDNSDQAIDPSFRSVQRVRSNQLLPRGL